MSLTIGAGFYRTQHSRMYSDEFITRRDSVLKSVNSKADDVSQKDSSEFQKKMQLLNSSEMRKSRYGGMKNREHQIQSNYQFWNYLKTFKGLD